MLFWDASSLAKRYGPELGSDVADALFASVPRSRMVVTFLGYAETYSVLLRKRNRGVISSAALIAARAALRFEVLDDPDFNILEVDAASILDGLDLMEQYNLSASDAAVLASYLD